MKPSELFYALFSAGITSAAVLKYGTWWGFLYGLTWPAWVGYRMAEWLLR